MEGHKLILELLYKLYKHLGLSNIEFEEKLIGDENILESSILLQTLTANSFLKSFIERVERVIRENPDGFLSTPYTHTGSVVILDFSVAPLKGRNRNFYFSDINIGFASTLSFFDGNEFTDFSESNKLLLWKQIENFIERAISVSNDTILTSLFNIIENEDKTKGILINKSGLLTDTKRCFSYIYLYALNFKGRLNLDIELKSSNRIISPSLTLNPVTTYEQYIDVMDVLNEVNHTTDILSRYLKIYHVLEYLTYRVTLSDIVSKVDQSKSFIRRVIQLSDSIRKSEKDTFLQNFKKLFSGKETDFDAVISPILTTANKSEIQDLYLGNNYDPANLKHNAELIYGLRCSIVHNKESEFHITISNPDEFRNLIPVIKKLSEVLEVLIVEKISMNEPLIQYTKPQLEFY